MRPARAEPLPLGAFPLKRLYTFIIRLDYLSRRRMDCETSALAPVPYWRTGGVFECVANHPQRSSPHPVYICWGLLDRLFSDYSLAKSCSDGSTCI